MGGLGTQLISVYWVGGLGSPADQLILQWVAWVTRRSADWCAGRESAARYDLLVKVENVVGLGSRVLNFAKTEVPEDVGAVPITSGIILFFLLKKICIL